MRDFEFYSSRKCKFEIRMYMWERSDRFDHHIARKLHATHIITSTGPELPFLCVRDISMMTNILFPCLFSDILI